MFLKKLKAISYVEVVLVLVIVGVVSSLAIPTLKRYSQKEELGRLAQKAYLTLNEAMDQSIMENGPTYKWRDNGFNFDKFIGSYLKTSSKNAALGEYLTKDGMKITYNRISNQLAGVSVDVNDTKGPNVSGKDIFEFDLMFSTSQIVPANDATKALFENNWKFTDELWNK